MAGSIFRSDEMALCQLFLHTDSAYMCVVELGEAGLVQFRDTAPETNSFLRKYIIEVRRCEEMERKLRFLEKEIAQDGIPLLQLDINPTTPAQREMIDMEAVFEKRETELRDINSNAEVLKKNFVELKELHFLLEKTRDFFYGADLIPGDQNGRPVTGDSENEDLSRSRDQRIQFLAGVLARKHMATFERVLWRACRGNVFLKRADIDEELEEPFTGEKVMKSAFVVFFQGDQLRLRVKKVSEAFHASLYPCPDTQQERLEMLVGVQTRLSDLNTVLNTTKEHRQRVLVEAAKMLQEWIAKVRKVKAVYHMLNLFNMDVTSRAMIGECWCSVEDLEKVHAALRRGMDRSNSSVAPILNVVSLGPGDLPPTYHRTNKFTQAFQNIVDAYGVAYYRESNPAPYAVITFPFLFGVMFGDAGHGLLMSLCALWMVIKEKQFMSQRSTNEVWNIMFGGRYIILLMGLFSMYAGTIYNDVFSKSANIFGSAWYPVVQGGQATLIDNKLVQLDPTDGVFSSFTHDKTYPFGLDPVWQSAKNKITFTNSIKMKMSIILGVMHMLFGVFMSLSNHVFRGDHLSIFCEFIPQVIFLTSIFGYLIVLIFIKWLKYKAAEARCAPSLLIALINMFMFKAQEKDPNKNPCAAFTMHDGEEIIRPILVVLAVICVPWMLLIKPFILNHRHKHRSQGYNRMDDSESGGHPPPPPVADGGHDGGHGGHGEGEFNMGEALVHQSIHTIEYCLGCISNTASYLRLWALSLAHAQLSEVLWSMLLSSALKMPLYVGAFGITLVFAMWAVLTVGILLLMEGLSAFLHALRLHWVEFMNKFYQGTGYAFQPFTFNACLLMSGEKE